MKLKEFLRHHAQFSRRKIDAKASLIADIDSTTHIQHALQMEGLDFDYKGNWGLSNLSCSDEMGFSHALELRSGNTFSSVFALIAHNHLRTVALLDNREKPLYAKRLRFKYILHPGRIVTHARRQILKLATRVMKEIRAMNTAWTATREF